MSGDLPNRKTNLTEADKRGLYDQNLRDRHQQIEDLKKIGGEKERNDFVAQYNTAKKAGRDGEFLYDWLQGLRGQSYSESQIKTNHESH